MSKVKVNDSEFIVETSDGFTSINGEKISTNLYKVNDTTYHLLFNNKSVRIDILQYDREKQLLSLLINDKPFETHVVNELEQTIEKMAISSGHQNFQTDLKSPMPGLIQKVLCAEGQEIKKGEQVIVLNAMKMENIIKASKDGVIKKIFIKEGEQVEKGKVLIQF